MSRSQAQLIIKLRQDVQDARGKLSEVTAEHRGEERGKFIVAEQLARDIHMGALREEQHRKNASRAYADLQRALRIVAAHILDARASLEGGEAAEMPELLAEEFEVAGIPLRPAFIAVQVERADAAAPVTAAEAAAAVASAPVPSHSWPRSSTR